MVELVLPDCLPVVEAAETPVGGTSQVPNSQKAGTVHMKKKVSREQKRSEMMEYIETKKMAFFLNTMLVALYKAKPSEPLKWCTNFLTRHTAVSEVPDQTQETANIITDEVRLWSAYWKIPYLIDELLAAILDERPEEPDTFAAAWFRWNAASFQARHYKGKNLPKAIPANWELPVAEEPTV